MAFYGCESLERIDIPESVTSIGMQAFRRSGLRHVVLPGSIQRVTTETFYGCTALEKVEIMDGVEAISSEAFAGCTSLESIVLPGSIKNLGSKILDSCKSLKEIRYGGTRAEWKSLRYRVRLGVTDVPVNCSDGMVR